MNEKTAQKARAIFRAFKDDHEWTLNEFASLLAMLTSPVKEEREFGKAMVRNLAGLGRQLEEADNQACLAAEAANRFEP